MLLLSIGASGGPESVSTIHETPSLHFYGSACSSELPKSLAAGRPATALGDKRDLASYGASFAQLLVKKNFDPVMSGHGAMTSQEVQVRPFCEK